MSMLSTVRIAGVVVLQMMRRRESIGVASPPGVGQRPSRLSVPRARVERVRQTRTAPIAPVKLIRLRVRSPVSTSPSPSPLAWLQQRLYLNRQVYFCWYWRSADCRLHEPAAAAIRFQCREISS